MDHFSRTAINSTFWSFVETIGSHGIQFIIGIILARLLVPEDFGLIGVLAIFLGVASVLVDSGFKTSIIRSNDISDIDYSTIFYVNFTVSVIICIILFASGSSIAFFFNKPELVNVTRAFSLIPLLNGIGLVQSALMFKNLQFKSYAKISITSNVISGAFAIFLAFNGFSYWALVWRAIISAGIFNSLLWIFNNWRPRLVFSFAVLRKHFQFGSRLLFTGMLDTFFDNIYSFIFGKFFSFKELGYFTRGKGYMDLVTKTLSMAIQKVNTPLLAATNRDSAKLIAYYMKLTRMTCFIVFPVAIYLIVVAKPAILFLIGEKWLPSVSFLQILVIPGMIYPINNANSSLFEVMGKSKIILRSALISRPIQLLILAISANYGSLSMTFGIALHSVFMLFLSVFFVSNLINIGMKRVFNNIFPAFIISITMGLILFIIGKNIEEYLTPGYILCIQLLCCFIITFTLMLIVSKEDLFSFIKIILPEIRKNRTI